MKPSKLYASFLLFPLLFLSLPLTAGVYYNWAKRIGDAGATIEVGKSIVSDANGNVYLTGLFKGTVDFDPGNPVFNLTAAGSNDNIFFAKYNANGNFLWAKQIGDANPSKGLQVQVDDTGNVYLLANFEVSTSLDFDPSAAVFNLSSQGYKTIAFAKYNSQGDLVWAKSLEGNDECYSTSIELSPQGDIYIAGEFKQTVDFDPTVAVSNLTSGGPKNGFFAKYTNLGNLIWVKQLVGATNEIFKLTVSNTGALFITGFYQNTCDFDPDGVGQFVRTNDGNSDFYVASYTENGQFTWAIALDGNGEDNGNAIAVDGFDNVYVAGTFTDSVDTDPSAIDNFLVSTSTGFTDNFLAKYDNAGNFVWSFKFGNSEVDYCYSLAAGYNGELYLTGAFKGAVDFDPGTSSTLLNAGVNYDMYLAHYDTDGNYSFAYAVGGLLSDEAFAIHLDANENLYLTGYFGDEVDFDVSQYDTVNLSGGTGDIFMAKYSRYAPLELLKPYAYSTWLVDANYPINWNGNGIDSIKIERLQLSQTNWELIDMVANSPSTYSYFLPANNPLDSYTIRLSDVKNPTVYAVTDVNVKFSPQLNYPLGGEIFAGDSLINVNWFSASSASAFFDLKYSTNGGTNWIRMRDSVQTFFDTDSSFYIGNYNWKVPSNLNSTNCKVGIFEVNQSSPLFASAAFTILPANPSSFTLLLPNGGEQLEKKKRYFITWTGVSMPPIVVLSYTVNGTNYYPIDTLPNLGFYEWRVADSISTTCRIKISNLLASASDISDTDFEIVASLGDDAELIAPLLGDNWCAGTQQYIRWTSNINGKIKLLYKPNSGSDQLIDSVNAADGMYFWTVPNNPSFQNRIRIEPIDGNSNLSTSDEFTICPNGPLVAVINPNGGENFYPGAYKAIRFVKSNIPLVDIEYSIDGGNSWNAVADSISSSPYYWLIPNTPSANCLVRVFASDLSNNADTSNFAFTILAPFIGTSPIITTTPLLAPPCKNTALQMYFTVSGGVFDTSNVFTAQLSDSLGNFSGNITTMGFVKDSVSDSILCFIPQQVVNGSQYKIRIVSDMPPTSSLPTLAFALNSPEFTFKDTINYYYLPNALASFPNLGPLNGASVLWNFGDGASSTSPTPIHKYTQSGIFDVSVTVTNTSGCSTSKTNRAYNRVDKKFPNRILNPNKNAMITGISFKNDSTGSISFSDGSVKFTNDYGTNWYAVQATGLTDIKAIKIKNAFEWLVVGNNGGVRKTVNRGLSWDTVTFANGLLPTVNFNAIDFSSPLSGYIAGDSGKVFRFANGKFNLASQFTQANLYAVYDDGINAFVAGDSGKIVKRSAGVWIHKQSGISSTIRSITFAANNSSIGYAVGDNGKIIQSNDAGDTWNLSLAGVDINFASVACSEYGDSAWAVGASGIIYQTMNQGLTWERFSKGATSSNTRVAYKVPNGYITGSSGSLRIFTPVNTNPVDSALSVNGIKYPSQAILIYPNPAKNEFNLAFYSEQSEQVKITVKDINGNELFVLSNQSATGTFVKTIDVSQLSAGIYFVHVSSANQYRIKKLILTK